MKKWMMATAAVALMTGAAQAQTAAPTEAQAQDQAQAQNQGQAQGQISGNTVKVGVMTDMTGTYSDIGGPGSVTAAQMAVEDFGGTVNGAPIEVVSTDHQNKPDIASARAREWIDTEGVDMITDLVTSSTGLAVQEIGKDKKTIIMNSGSATSRLTNDDCSPYGFHWTYDTYALANGTGRAVVEQGGDSWFFLTADYAFGHSLEEDVTKVVNASGGEVLGSVRHPFPSSDFASFLLQAQGSGAKVIGLANAGADTINSIKQAKEFGIVEGGQSLAGLLMFITDIHALGLDTAQGLYLTTGWYWDLNDETREWAARFEEKMGKKPTMVQAGVYSAVTNYLKAIEAAGSDNADAVADQLHGMKIDDMFADNGVVYPNGRMAHDMYLARVKSPDQSQGPWDYLEIVQTIPAEEAFQKPEETTCPLVKQ
jgi:branched-chain amino acid transport system substrate-binding protein